MQDKQKVTLYIPPGVHRQLKIRAAVDSESMSTLVEKAISFYLKYPEKVAEVESALYGKTHQVHICPECEAALVVKEGQLLSLKQQPSVITEEFSLETVPTQVNSEDPPELVPC